MADVKKPVEAEVEVKPATPTAQQADAVGAQQKLEADSKLPGTTTPPAGDKAPEPGAPASTNTAAGDTPAAKTPAGADKAEGEDAEATPEPSLYDRTVEMSQHALDEFKGFFGLGQKPTEADLKKLPAVHVEGATPEQAAAARAAGRPLPGDTAAATPTAADAALEGAQVKAAGAKPGEGIWDKVVWGVKALTPDFIETGLSTATQCAIDGFDWLTDWYGSNDDLLADPNKVRSGLDDFSNLVENRVLTKGETTTAENSESMIASRLPAGMKPDQVRDMLANGLGTSLTVNNETGGYTQFDKDTRNKHVENADGSATLVLGDGTTVRRDVDGNVTWLFNDGAIKEGIDGTKTASFGDWQKEQIAASDPLRSEIRQDVRQAERDDDRVRVQAIDSASKGSDMINLKVLDGVKVGGQPVTADRARELLNGLPGATTEVLQTEADKGKKVQEIDGVRRVESEDGKTVTLQFQDGTTVTRNEQGTTWHKPKAEGRKAETLVESADGRQFSYASGELTVQAMQELSQRVNSERNKTVRDIIQDTYADLLKSGKTHEEALAEIAKEQIIGGRRLDGDVTDGNRRSGFMQQIDGKWYQVNSNGQEIHLREVTQGADGQLEFGTQFSQDPTTGQWTVDGQPYTGNAPKLRVGENGQVLIGENGDLSLERDGKKITVHGRLHNLTANGDGTSSFTSEHKPSGEKIVAAVEPKVVTELLRNNEKVGEAEIGPEGQLTSTLVSVDPETGEITTPQERVLPDGTTVVPGLGGMQFRPNGDIIGSDGQMLYNGSTGAWSAESGIVGMNSPESQRMRAENARIESQAQSTSAKVQSIGSMALSIARSGDPNALSILRHLAWAGIGMADAGIAAAGGNIPAVITLSLAKSYSISALNVTNDQGRALSELTRLGIFDATTQKQAMIAGSLGSTYITPESAALHFAKDRRPELRSVA